MYFLVNNNHVVLLIFAEIMAIWDFNGNFSSMRIRKNWIFETFSIIVWSIYNGGTWFVNSHLLHWAVLKNIHLVLDKLSDSLFAFNHRHTIFLYSLTWSISEYKLLWLKNKEVSSANWTYFKKWEKFHKSFIYKKGGKGALNLNLVESQI